MACAASPLLVTLAPMRLLLLSHHLGAIPGFLGTPREEDRAHTRIAYIDDAATPFADAGFIRSDRNRLAQLGYELSDVTCADLSSADVLSQLSNVEAMYLAGGAADSLMHALRASGADRIILDKVQQGVPLMGCGAGSVVMGLSTTPDILMDGQAEGLEDEPTAGLGLIDSLIVTHADGQLPPYPKPLIDDVVRQLGDEHPITLISDDKALLVDDSRVEMIDSPPMDRRSGDPLSE